MTDAAGPESAVRLNQSPSPQDYQGFGKNQPEKGAEGNPEKADAYIPQDVWRRRRGWHLGDRERRRPDGFAAIREARPEVTGSLGKFGANGIGNARSLTWIGIGRSDLDDHGVYGDVRLDGVGQLDCRGVQTELLHDLFSTLGDV